MDKKIKEFAEQAGSTHKPSLDVYQFYTYELEKFAELIIRECASSVEHILREKSLGGGTYANHIKEHFGIAKE